MGCTSAVFHANKYLDERPEEYVRAMLPAWGRKLDADDARERPVPLVKVGRAIAAHMRYRMPWRSDPEPSHAAARAITRGWLRRRGDGVVLTDKAVRALADAAERQRQREAASKRWRTRRINEVARRVAAEMVARS